MPVLSEWQPECCRKRGESFQKCYFFNQFSIKGNERTLGTLGTEKLARQWQNQGFWWTGRLKPSNGTIHYNVWISKNIGGTCNEHLLLLFVQFTTFFFLLQWISKGCFVIRVTANMAPMIRHVVPLRDSCGRLSESSWAAGFILTPDPFSLLSMEKGIWMQQAH